MTDLTHTIAAKSDQLNAGDLIGGAITVEVTKVALASTEQPVAVNYKGDNGKPFYPCKTMRRVMIHLWGADGNAYVGRKMTLFRDPKVIFGGAEVGGIRISHMSHIDAPVTMTLTATKKSKKPYTVLPLVEGVAKPKVDKAQAAKDKADSIIAEITADPANAHIVLEREKAVIERLKSGYGDLHKAIMDAVPKPPQSAAAATMQAAMDEGLLDDNEIPL